MPNNGMHPTVDTLLVMFNQRCGAAGDAGRSASGECIKMQNIQFKVNPDVYVAQLQKELAAHFADLHNALRTIEDGSFVTRATTPRPEGVVQFQLDTAMAHGGDAVGRACNSCFLNLVRTLINYIDRMVALKRCINQPVPIPSGGLRVEDLQRFLENHLEETYQAVARNTRLTNPVKLGEFDTLTGFPRKTTLSYFELRRCLEHRNAVPEVDITIWFLKLTILAGHEEITSLPFVAGEGTNISVRVDRLEKTFQSNTKVVLTEEDIERVFSTIQYLIGPEIRRVLGTSDPDAEQLIQPDAPTAGLSSKID